MEEHVQRHRASSTLGPDFPETPVWLTLALLSPIYPAAPVPFLEHWSLSLPPLPATHTLGLNPDTPILPASWPWANSLVSAFRILTGAQG